MGKFNPADSGYVEVKDRIEEFYKKFPEGSIQTEIVMLNDNKVVMKAAAFRDREDQRPGIGHSGLGIPGETTFTKGSELENAETSAVGRAIANLGFEVKRFVASADEIRMKQGEDEKADEAEEPKKNKLAPIFAKAKDNGISKEVLAQLRLNVTGKHSAKQFDDKDIAAMLAAMDDPAQVAAAATGGEVVE